MAEQWEGASRVKLSQAKARSVIEDIYQIINHEVLETKTARKYLDDWAKTRGLVTSPRTAAAYSQIVRDFLESLGGRADLDIAQLTKADVASYRDKVLLRTSPQTANKAIKYLRVALGAAWKDGVIERNPAQQVDTLRVRPAERNERRPFTLDELKAILAVANAEWRGMILFGFYTGQRLGDIAGLTWRSIDLQRGELRFTTEKTRRRSLLPMAKPLLSFVSTMPASDDPDAPLFPEAFRVAKNVRDRSALSQGFHELLVKANLALPRSKKEKDGDGAGRRRARTVHRFRFTACGTPLPHCSRTLGWPRLWRWTSSATRPKQFRGITRTLSLKPSARR